MWSTSTWAPEAGVSCGYSCAQKAHVSTRSVGAPLSQAHRAAAAAGDEWSLSATQDPLGE